MTKLGIAATIIFVAVGCVDTQTPFCDEYVPLCPRRDYSALCTLDGEEPDWTYGDPDWSRGAEPLRNGTLAVCGTRTDNIACQERADWPSEDHERLVLACHCHAPGACD